MGGPNASSLRRAHARLRRGRGRVAYRESGISGWVRNATRTHPVQLPGNDTGTNTSLNAEYVSIGNHVSTSRNLRGWTLRDNQSHVYSFPNITVGSGKSVTVHTGKGTNTSTNLYWGSRNYIWNNSGDRATLRDAQGHQIDTCSWGNGSGSINC